MGDAIYGERAEAPLQLLARGVVVPLMKTKPPVAVEAPAPPHMRATLPACGFTGDCPAGLFGRSQDRYGVGNGDFVRVWGCYAALSPTA